MAKILVVDDVDMERLNMVGILRKAGYEVVEAKDGQQAVDAAKAQKFDAIMMDIVMPIMDGFQATKKLRMSADTRDIPVVIVSSKNQESDRFRAEQVGARGYLAKPATSASVLAVLKSL